MNITFTGHRDRTVDPIYLERLLKDFPGAHWIQGGARGFDTQVKKFAEDHGFVTEEIRPDYKTYYHKQAPTERDKEMVAMADMLVACWDGRTVRSGTYNTIGFARKKGIPIRILKVCALCGAMATFERSMSNPEKPNFLCGGCHQNANDVIAYLPTETVWTIPAYIVKSLFD